MEKSATQIKAALVDMKAELLMTKKAVEEFMDDIKGAKPEDVSLDTDVAGGEFGEAGKEAPEMGEEEGKEKKPEIKTTEDAKKVLEEAKTDLSDVVEHLDGLCGQAEEETEKVAFKRINDRYASDISGLGKSAFKAIADAKSSLKYWSFLKSRINATSNIKNASLKQTLETVKEAQSVWQALGGIFGGNKKTATAVPPTSSEFSGDKWPKSGNPADKELEQWHKENAQFKKDIKKDYTATNPAKDDRLKGEAVDEQTPVVYATLYMVPNNKYASFWQVNDSMSKTSFKVTFASVPDRVGKRDERGFNIFTSKGYGEVLATNVIENGASSVKAYLNGESGKTAALDATAVEKGSVRKYYAEAMGDSSYAKDMTAGGEKGMEQGYKPERSEVKEEGETKKGPGTIASTRRAAEEMTKAEEKKEEKAEEKKEEKAEEKKEASITDAHIRRALEISRKAAAVGVIPFTKQAVKEYSMTLLKKTAAVVEAIEDTLNNSPILNEAALKEAHIPETEKGIVGNKSEGVRDPKAEVATEDLNSNVKSDAKISAIVPQAAMKTFAAKTSPAFNTTEARLKQAGLDVNTVRLRRPTYRS